MTPVEIRHFHLFAGLGGGAKGFNRAQPRVGNLQARFRCIGGIDVDPAAMRDFHRLAGVPGTVLDLFDRDQYRAFHDAEPPVDWQEATTADIHRAAGHERPHIVFLSAPCKGFSGLLSETRSRTDKYQALNRLTLRGVWLMLEAWKDDAPELIVFENVPRIATRGRHLLDQIVDLLRAYGYAVAETTHDCGELGGLAQSRKRFLLVARHIEKVAPFLYEPERRPLQAVGSVLGRMPLPGDLRAGPMHRVPQLQWKTWVRLAFVEAGTDWRSLNRLAVEGGQLRDYLLVPEMHRGGYGVRAWDEPTGVVASESRPSNGAFSVADPRIAEHPRFSHAGFRVLQWDQTAGTVTGGANAPGSSAQQVADPRHNGPAKHSNEFRVVRWEREACAVTGAHGTGQCVADPRSTSTFAGKGKYIVTPFDEPANTVIAASTTGNGAFAVADPRPGLQRDAGDAYLTGGHYGVVPWDQPSGAVSAAAGHDNGRWSVADPRMPRADEKLVVVIRAEDGTWHRPFTTFELGALQSLVDPEEQLELDGLSDSAWRERIGNAVPPHAAEAIAHVMGTTLLLAWSGETFVLSAQPIWVRPIALAAALGQVAV
ncbi:DNA cytosine methyltransferase [Aquincola tertiaricarbonis]|uniref:DNA cytosine methyltransferase n=1 Tax=Aquincola tertiaricarbonis TaxID=391953 RepID=UPI000614E6A8|nr:DNA cytosine methyltransferase [Aquincola tertiaricarbonis]